MYIASRSEVKAHKAIEDLYRDNKSLKKDSLAFLKLDLEDIKSVVAAADEFGKLETRLDILGKNPQNSHMRTR